MYEINIIIVIGGNVIKDGGMRVSEDGDWSTLDIKSIEFSDEEDYQCIAENELGTCKTTMELLVDEKKGTPGSTMDVVDGKEDISKNITKESSKVEGEVEESGGEVRFLRELPKELLINRGAALQLEVRVSHS